MSTPDTMILNSLEQILSGDINRIGTLYGKAVQDALLALAAGIDSAVAPQDVVRRGLVASAGAGLSVDVTAGEAMRYDAAASGSDESRLKYGRLEANTNVALSAADPSNPRVDLIYATFSTVNTDSTTRSQLVLPARTVSSVSLNKSARPRLTLAVTTGTPGANPALPATPAGGIPLWYAYVPAAAVSITDTHLLDARRRFHPWALAFRHQRELGLYAGPDLSALADNPTSVELQSGRAWINGALTELDANVSFSGAAILPSGSGTLSADTDYHVYLVATGMGADAPVGKLVSNGIIPVAVSANAPLGDGRPTSAITYRPLFGSGIDTFQLTTANALYIGTLCVKGTANNLSHGTQPLNQDGSRSSALLPDGRLTIRHGFLRLPNLTWTDADTVTATDCVGVIGGQPFYAASTTITVSGSKILTDTPVEAPSTLYYLYLRRRLAARTYGINREVVGRLSTVAPTSSGGYGGTPEAGFVADDYLCIGTCWNNASSNLVAFVRNGFHMRYQDVIAMTSSTGLGLSATTITVAPIPAYSRQAILNPELLASGQSGAAGHARIVEIYFQEPTTGDAFYQSDLYLLTPDGAEVFGIHNPEVIVPLDASKEFDALYALSSTGRTDLATINGVSIRPRVVGYIDNFMDGL